MILVYYFLRVYEIVLFIRIFMSWVHPDPGHPVVKFIYSVTDPVLDPIRRMLPIGGMGFDLSPIVVFIIIEILQKFFMPYAHYGY